MNWKTNGIVALVIIIIIFILQNREVVPVRFLFWSLQMSRVVVLFTTFLLGVLAGWAYTRFVKRF
ncbi:MAG: LapA family protein [Candidatus Omnitrophica bacterium]|nr:LapA family protein [Candidatus Omnitrophota bacterium]